MNRFLDIPNQPDKIMLYLKKMFSEEIGNSDSAAECCSIVTDIKMTHYHPALLIHKSPKFDDMFFLKRIRILILEENIPDAEPMEMKRSH